MCIDASHVFSIVHGGLALLVVMGSKGSSKSARQTRVFCGTHVASTHFFFFVNEASSLGQNMWARAPSSAISRPPTMLVDTTMED